MLFHSPCPSLSLMKKRARALSLIDNVGDIDVDEAVDCWPWKPRKSFQRYAVRTHFTTTSYSSYNQDDRHNIGREVVTYCARQLTNGQQSPHGAFKSFMRFRPGDILDRTSLRRAKRTKDLGVPFPDVETYFLCPNEYMNNSGHAVRNFVHSVEGWNFAIDDILVVFDDISLPFGTCRFRFGGRSGGHRGLKDVAKQLGTDRFSRLRIGIDSNLAQETESLANFVLSPFTPNERQTLHNMDPVFKHLILLYVHRGIQTASMTTNGKNFGEIQQLCHNIEA